MVMIAGAIYADESVINITGNTLFDHNSAEGETRDKIHVKNPVTASTSTTTWVELWFAPHVRPLCPTVSVLV